MNTYQYQYFIVIWQRYWLHMMTGIFSHFHSIAGPWPECHTLGPSNWHPRIASRLVYIRHHATPSLQIYCNNPNDNTTSTELLGWTWKWLCKPHHHPTPHRTNSIIALRSLTLTFITTPKYIMISNNKQGHNNNINNKSNNNNNNTSNNNNNNYNSKNNNNDSSLKKCQLNFYWPYN